MALILVIETATKNCSLALCENGITIESIDYNDGNFSHAEKLHVFIEEILSKLEEPNLDNEFEAFQGFYRFMLNRNFFENLNTHN